MTNLFNLDISQIKHNGNEVSLIKLNGSIIYKTESETKPLYKPIEFQGNTKITEAVTMVDSSHNSLYGMFSGCTNLISVNTNDWYVTSVTDMGYMFSNCTSLTELDLSDWVLNSAVNCSYMFNGCTSLHTIRLDNCSNSTIYKLLKSNGFPTNKIDGITRTIYVKKSAVTGSGFIISEPTNWVFSYIDE